VFQVRECWRAVPFCQAKDGRISVQRLPFQYLAYGWHRYATEPYATAYMVLGAYLVTTQTPDLSAVQFQRQLGLRYETVFKILHKLRAGMVRPERDSIGAQYPVEVDETLVGGRTKGEGCGVHHKAIVVGAGVVRPRVLDADGQKHKKALYAGKLRLRLAPNRSAKALTGIVQETVVKEQWCAPMDGTATMGWQSWGTRTSPWCSMSTVKRPMPTFL
jgi:hypothetical protein